MEFNRPARVTELAAVALAMGAQADASSEELADQAIERVAALLASVGIPSTLADLRAAVRPVEVDRRTGRREPRADATTHDPSTSTRWRRSFAPRTPADRAALREARPEPSSQDLTSTAAAR